jgi:cell division septation protein DedD
MRGTVAEQRADSHNSKVDGGAVASRGAGSYTAKSSQHSDRGDGQLRRGAGGRWELRLGTLQVTVWLGLAIGACVGGYFVGFFSGRYVGFESARQGSSGEAPKLPAPEILADASTLNPNRVYDRLKAPAILPDSGGPRASAKVSDVGMADEANSRLKVSEVEGIAGSPQKLAVAKGGNADSSAAGSDEDIFDDGTSEERVIIGADGGLAEELEEKLPSSVRMLGDSSPVATGASNASGKSGKGDSVSAAAVLDARIANARTEVSRVAQPSAPEAAEPKKAVADVGSKATESTGLVKKVLPSGYFAQVAAPKKLNEAEAVAKKLKRSGFPVVVETASVNGQSFYRVLVGPEENKVQAERLVSQLQSESYVASKPFIRKVK